ncbi:hypothetical protein Q5752_001192 [Cryptotrichosporon argae]
MSDGTTIDARSIVTLVVFFVVNALVIFPLYIPLPLAVSRALDRLARRAGLQPSRERPIDPEADAPVAIEGGETLSSSESASGVTDVADARGGEVGTTGRAGHDDSVGEKQDERAKRWHVPLNLATAPVIGVLLLLASTCIPGSVVRTGIVGSGGLRPYDIMTLFISFAYIAISLDATGLFRYLAFLVASRSSSSGPTLFFSFYAFFVVCGLIMGNDPIVLSGTPFLAYFTAHARVRPPTAFLFAQFQAANLVSALLVSSNPTNLVLTSAFGISFLRFSAWTALPTVAAAAALYPFLRFVVFRQDKYVPREIARQEVNARAAFKDPAGGIFGTALFLVVIVLLVGLSAGGKLEGTEGVWTVTAPAAIIVFLRDCVHDWRTMDHATRGKGGEVELGARPSLQEAKAAESAQPASRRAGQPPRALSTLRSLAARFPTAAHVIAHLPLPLLPFAFSMFILVDALDYTGWIRVWAGWWVAWARVGGTAGCIWLMGTLGVLGCNVFGTNIGATVLLARVLEQWRAAETVSDRSLYGAVFALAIGTNFGAYSFVYPASLAGLLWRDILVRRGIVIRPLEFARRNAAPLTLTMAVACLVVAAEVCVIY